MCKFCEKVELWKQINEKDDYGDKKNMEFAVSLLVFTWGSGRPKTMKSRIQDYRNRGHGYKLNFCPECGKEMKGAKYGRKRSG